MEPPETQRTPPEGIPSVAERQAPLEALENQERRLEAAAAKGMSPESLLKELTELGQKQGEIQSQRFLTSEALVTTEDPETQQQAKQASDEARAELERHKQAFLQEASAALGNVTDAAEGAVGETDTIKTALEQTEKTIAEFSARQPLDAVGASYVDLMESYRSLLHAQMAKQDTRALVEEYNKKALAYQELTKTNG